MLFEDAYKNKLVLVTGHTGFKGSWLCEWLNLLGAKIVGLSLEPPSNPSHFSALNLSEQLAADLRGDVSSLELLESVFNEYVPDFVFHLAAQPLVLRAFDDPYNTIETNVLGTLNVLEAVRRANRDCVLVMITTDKVYENFEWEYSYRENDRLGGYDPYSASKAAAEILISSYQRSFFDAWQRDPQVPMVLVARGRGGNVIGGGDWAEDRIVPDCIRSLTAKRQIQVRNRLATRPWQHVLELISGYLHLAAEISRAVTVEDTDRLLKLCSAFNFGPQLPSNKTVEALVLEIIKHWPGEWRDFTSSQTKHEAGRLSLAWDRAYHLLGWQPHWTFEETVKYTIDWYRGFYETTYTTPEFVRRLTQNQILSFASGLDYRTVKHRLNGTP